MLNEIVKYTFKFTEQHFSRIIHKYKVIKLKVKGIEITQTKIAFEI